MNRALWKIGGDSKTEPQSNRGSSVPLEEAEGRICRRVSRRIASARRRSRGRVPPAGAEEEAAPIRTILRRENDETALLKACRSAIFL